jgi:hypothetical protein
VYYKALAHYKALNVDFPQQVAPASNVPRNFPKFSNLKRLKDINYVVILFTYKISSKNTTLYDLCKTEKGDE